jgi:hypothetical protein
VSQAPTPEQERDYYRDAFEAAAEERDRLREANEAFRMDAEPWRTYTPRSYSPAAIIIRHIARLAALSEKEDQ